MFRFVCTFHYEQCRDYFSGLSTLTIALAFKEDNRKDGSWENIWRKFTITNVHSERKKNELF